MHDDVIFALASGPGRAAVAVLRLSGRGTSAAVEALAAGGYRRYMREDCQEACPHG